MTSSNTEMDRQCNLIVNKFVDNNDWIHIHLEVIQLITVLLAKVSY